MYRMERAFEMLIAAEDNLKIGQYKTSLNRSYYAIFPFLNNPLLHLKKAITPECLEESKPFIILVALIA